MDFIPSPIRYEPRGVFRRCVQCPTTSPTCPTTCTSNEVCQLNPQSCTHCASTTCVAASEVNNGAASATATPSSGGSASSGAIAGGIIGGIALIAVVTFLVWKFVIKKRRTEERNSYDYNLGSEKDINEPVRSRDPRASTHTVASFASSAFTRASNIIPIAYIPGVTNRSVHSSQDLVPPVPPIPAASPSTSPRMDGEEQHYFRPDIRDSRYSAYTDRNSIASTIYRSNAIVNPVPAQMVSRAKPTAVSVRSSNKNSPTISRSTTPPMPNIPSGFKTLSTKSSIVGRVAQPKPVQIQAKGSRTKHIYELDGSVSGRPSRQSSLASPYNISSPNTDDGSSDDERALGRSLIPTGQAVNSASNPAELDAYSPEGDEAGMWGDKVRHKKSTSLNQIIEEAAMQASRAPAHLAGYSQPRGDAGPFSDDHEAHTP